MNTNKNFEQVIKNVLENYELPYNHADWLKLEKSLPKASGISPLKIIVASVSTTIVIIGAIFTYFYLNDTEINSVNKTRLTNTNLSVIQPAQNISIPSAKDNSGTVTNKDNLQNPVHTNSKSLFSEQPQSAEQIIKNYDNSKTTQAITDNSNITNDESANNNQVFSAQQLNNIRKYEQAPPCAKFTADYFEGCSPLSVNFYLLENSDTIIYLWDFGDGQISTEQQPSHIYNDPGEYIVSLTVKYYKTELLVNYTNTTPIKVKLSPNPDFSYENNQYKFSFINQTQDGYMWRWFIDEQEFSTDENPETEIFYNGNRKIKLISSHLNGCSKMITKTIDVKIKAPFTFPNAFTPNGDGLGDYFGPIAKNPEDYQFNIRIFNRQGQLVFESNDFSKKWDGKIRGTNKIGEEGVYCYQATITDRYGNVDKETGNVTLLEPINE